MTVLGIDTSTSGTSVALLLPGGAVSEARDDPPAGAHPGHATRLLALAESLLADAGLGWPELRRIAVGVGPGTFTGLRVGVATARALAQSRDLELVGVGSLVALAEPALASGRVLAVIDARRGEVFAAAFGAGGGGPVELAPPAAVAPERLREVLSRCALPGSPGSPRGEGGAAGEGWVAVGDGAVRYRSHVEATGVRVPGDDDQLHRVTAAAVCRLGVGADAAATVVPDYRRRPDAELALERTAPRGT
ncbi:MAG TPA: tRNA (adenosine(37)-N6)-threonylcarbamoyltransferase complex dimerization subunit type 1 TsaB [Solirubrobacteraceae bacterium]|nr:tRNA (adenosine(37)-N6)-threonylcarbamoyltransferase complex dimerization subunit type 1 TsaB [Solirubrobacteraceae bacterium]